MTRPRKCGGEVSEKTQKSKPKSGKEMMKMGYEISGSLESIEPHIHYFKNRLEHHLNTSLLQTTDLKNGREINENSLKLGAGCSYLLGRVHVYKSDLLANYLKYKYALLHYNTPSPKID
jgi:hypothetical protein